MAEKHIEYLFSINQLNKPTKVEGKEAIGTLILRLLLLKPNSDPLHPEMGVGIENYRFAQNRLDELKTRITDQMRTYLPQYEDISVELIEISSDKICNIQITVDDTVYVYDSKVAPIPISLQDIGFR